ncbi:MAG TPA: hypothetical protein PK661_09475 [Syntrophorhabdaceae bacterium]|nr:hypothetical protein [Syntrophorhabdaceae bacterium]
MPLKIWGWSSPKEKITILFDKKKHSITAGIDGKWSIMLPQQKAGGPYTMEISGRNGNEFHKIKVSVESKTEIFPVIQKYLAQDGKSGDTIWKLTNPGDSLRTVTVTSYITNWTDPVSKTVNLRPKDSITIEQISFGEKLLYNEATTTPASLHLIVKEGDKPIFEETRQVEIRNVEDILWSTGEKKFDLAFLIASWVTPRDPAVEAIISRAKKRMEGNAFIGYQKGTPQSVRDQMEAIFNELRKYGLSYVDSSIDFGKAKASQRVRLPRTSLRDKQANCIDISVLLASCYENIGLKTAIILVPRHAFLAVRCSLKGKQAFFIDATNIGRSILDSVKDSINAIDFVTTFDAALKNGNLLFNEYKGTENIHFVEIEECRKIGVRPIF